MKILKYLLIIVALILIGGWAYVATQPDSYDVFRSKLIKAPASVIFENLNEFKNWEEWGPWMEEDSTIVVSYPEITSGVGSSYTWTSDEGSGRMEMISVVENKSLEQTLQFDDYEPSGVYWILEETEEGTNVTWGMKNDNTPFMFKFFGVISGGMDAMMGPMEEKGLENLNNVIIKELLVLPPDNTNYRIGVISQKEIPIQNFIGYFNKAKLEELPSLFQEYMPKAGQYAAENNIPPSDYTPAAVYIKWDEEKGETEFYIGLMVKNLTPATGMDAIEILAGNVVTLSKFGNYGDGDMEAHNNIANYFKNNSLDFGKLVWELYVNDPMEVKPEDIQTDIYYQIK